MLKGISWTEYLSVVAVVLAVYYFIIIWKFYKDEIRQILAGKGNVLLEKDEREIDSSQ